MLAASKSEHARARIYSIKPSIMSIHHVDLFTFTRRFIPTYPGYALRIPSLLLFPFTKACERSCLIFARGYIFNYSRPRRQYILHLSRTRKLGRVFRERGSSQSFSRRMRPMEFRVARRIIRRACGRHKVARAVHITRDR